MSQFGNQATIRRQRRGVDRAPSATVRRRLFFGALLLVAGCRGSSGDSIEIDVRQQSHDDEAGEAYVALAENGPFEATSIVFDQACNPREQTITIAAVGDLLLHNALQTQAFADSENYRSLWTEVVPLLEQADLSYANLEGAVAAGLDEEGHEVGDPGKVYGEDGVYTSFPQFNYHPQLVQDLVSSGIDVVSTANNHALDRGSLGVDRTIEALEDAGLPYTGTRLADDSSGSFHAALYAGDFKLAFLGCTFGTNGISNGYRQVLNCFDQRTEVIDAVEALSTRDDIDAVIFTPHWGSEYDANPTDAQIELAHAVLDAGAIAVIGTHPHVLQPFEHYETADGRETFIAYSLGNFVSNQKDLETRSSILLYLGIGFDEENRPFLDGARFVPLYTLRDDEHEVVPVDPANGRFPDALAHTLSILGADNLLRPPTELVSNPQCDPNWEPEKLTASFIGDPCTESDECAFDENAFCHEMGFCTTTCEGTCASGPGYAENFCAELSTGEGTCVARPDESNGQCSEIPGTSRRSENRYVGSTSEAPVTASVCAPAD